MTKSLYPYVVTVFLLGACSSSAQQTASPSKAPATPAQPAQAQQMPKGNNTNSDAGVMADFKKRVDDYVKLRDKAEKASPDLEKKSQPTEITTAEKSIAHHVRTARATAKRGDMFTPATQAMFRRVLRPLLTKGSDAAENKATIKDDAPEPKELPFKVNAEYPKQVPLSTVPPDVLAALPQLPEDIQYRFAGKHLILFDAKANLIIDFMLNAIP
jgi:PBP1b-binding outer membrane lipoprotein LpoB